MIETIFLPVGGLAGELLTTGYAANLAMLLAIPFQTPA